MAGDWIKIEHTTPDKPELEEMAEALGVSPETVLGHLIKLWIWADQQSLDGNALRVTKQTLNKRSGLPNLAEAMLSTGWLKGKDMAYSFPNFTRHNGNSAKKRGLTNKRGERFRNAASVSNVTLQALPEKRRSNTITNTSSNITAASNAGRNTPLNNSTSTQNPASHSTANANQAIQEARQAIQTAQPMPNHVRELISPPKPAIQAETPKPKPDWEN